MSESEARRLAEERARLREGRDFGAADVLRGRIEELGYRVEDRAGGFDLIPLEPSQRPRLRPEEVPSALDAEPDHDVSVHWLSEGWPDDVGRGIASFSGHAGGRRVQHVVVEATAHDHVWDPGVDVVSMAEGLGWAGARNAGLERSLGRMVMVVDGSVEATGDVFGPLEAALADPTIGLAGPVGAVTEGLREFVPAEGSDCDAIEGYLMAFRRQTLAMGVRFDPAFRFYRSADLDFSFRVKDLGMRAVVVDVPIRRHEHRTWSTTSPADRARLSKRNHYRFLDRWRGRVDLTVAGQASSE